MLKLFRSKKGDISFITGMILVLVSFAIVSAAVMQFSSKSSDREAEVLCKTSVDMRARTQINIDGTLVDKTIKPIPTMCKTIDRKVYGSREEILEQISYSMARCWWMFGEGRYEEILEKGSSPTFNFYGDGWKNGCFNCYTILIDEDEIEGGPITSEELSEYVYSHKHPDYSNITYLDYIQYYGGPGKIAISKEIVSPRNSYAIYFISKNRTAKEDQSDVGNLEIALGALNYFTPYGSALIIQGIRDLLEASAENDVSVIGFDSLAVAQENCGSGDIAGK